VALLATAITNSDLVKNTLDGFDGAMFSKLTEESTRVGFLNCLPIIFGMTVANNMLALLPAYFYSAVEFDSSVRQG